MAMEYRKTIEDAHSKPITCISYHPFRKEIFTASEDNSIRVWESDTGKLIATLTDHKGWVTNLFFCKELKVLFSCSIDGQIIVWNQNYKVIQKIATRSAVHSLNFNARRNQLLAGFHSKVLVYPILKDEDRPLAINNGGTSGSAPTGQGNIEVLTKRPVVSSEHTDVVKCLVACESRFYSAGYDGRMVIYDSPHHGDSKLRVISSISNAHDAAISCMVYGKDADNSWIITGGFDRVVKLWSLDGKCLQRFDGISDTISSICYVLPTQTLWVSANSPSPAVYDPRGGINISEFVDTSHPSFYDGRNTTRFKQLIYVQEQNEVISITNKKSIIIWKFNAAAPMTMLQVGDDVVETVTYTNKEPLLIFCGGGNGVIKKCERLQLNAFMYSQETLPMPREEHSNGDQGSTFSRQDSQNKGKRNTAHKGIEPQPKIKNPIDPTKFAKKQESERDGYPGKVGGASVMKLLYYDPLDLLLCGFEDAKIGVWGYNEEAFKSVPGTNIEIQTESATTNNNNNTAKDGVSNRVAGLTCRYRFQEHRAAVTSICAFPFKSKVFGNDHKICHYMLTSGEDRKVCLYDLEKGYLADTLKDPTTGREELVADGAVNDIDYSPETERFAYASSDGQAYIRKFSEEGKEMTLVAVLQGHESEVTQIKWSKKHQQWITGSEDRTIRMWPAEGIICNRILYNDSSVTCLCLDLLNGCIISGSMDKIIRVFDPEKGDEAVQKNEGHTDAVKSIVHIPIRNQYVSVAWDQTLRVWHAYFKKGQKRVVAKIQSSVTNDGESVAETSNTDSLLVSDVPEEKNEPCFSDLNPLIIPKLLTKAAFARDILADPPKKSDDEDTSDEKKHINAVENELRSVLNDLEQQLNLSEKGHLHGKKRGAKYANKAHV